RGQPRHHAARQPDRQRTAAGPARAEEPGVTQPRSPLVAWRTLTFPADWDATFGFAGPLELEVGFGDGRFTVRRAAAEPATRFVGLEVSSGSLQRALRRIKRQQLGNVVIAKVGAEFALRELFAA